MFQTTNQYMSQCAYQESWLMYFWSLRPTKPGWRHVLLNQIVSSHLAYGHGMAIKTYQNMHFFRGIQQPGPPISNTLWKITIFNGKTHYKWPFSIAMLNYQRVSLLCHPQEIARAWPWQSLCIAFSFDCGGREISQVFGAPTGSGMISEKDGTCSPSHWCLQLYIYIIISLYV